MPKNPDYETADDIPEHIVKRYSSLKGVQLSLTGKYGIGNYDGKTGTYSGKWGREQVIEYILKTPSKNKKKVEARELVKTTLKDRVAKVLKKFDNYTPNDEASVHHMVSLEMQIESIAFRLADPVLRADDYNKYAQLQTKFSAERRQLEKSLGIDRESRDTQVDIADEIKRFTEGAKKLLLDRSVPITCPKCKRKINQGYILFHFAGNVPYRWWSLCPNPDCGADIIIQGDVEPSTDWRELVGLNKEKDYGTETKVLRSPDNFEGNGHASSNLADTEAAGTE